MICVVLCMKPSILFIEDLKRDSLPFNVRKHKKKVCAAVKNAKKWRSAKEKTPCFGMARKAYRTNYSIGFSDSSLCSVDWLSDFR